MYNFNDLINNKILQKNKLKIKKVKLRKLLQIFKFRHNKFIYSKERMKKKINNGKVKQIQ
jgi:hypothetical protein